MYEKVFAWHNVSRAKDQGGLGLGIIDIKAHNTALLLKFLHKFYNKHDLPWVQLTWKHLYRNQNKAPHEYRPKGSFWWRSVIRLAGNFFMLAAYEANEGSTVTFCNDQWNQRILKNSFPQLHSFSINNNITVKGFLNSTTHQNFWLPLSLQASAQLTVLQGELNDMHLDPDIQDR